MDIPETPRHPLAHMCSPTVGRSYLIDDRYWLVVRCFVCGRFYEEHDITDIMRPLYCTGDR